MATGYVPTTYASILEEMLAAGARPGQGGHLEATPASAERAGGRLYASCWSFLAVETANALGMDAALPLLRDAVRGIGRYLGCSLRREVEARGLPLDLQSMADCWGGTEGGYLLVSPVLEPHYYAYHVVGCYFNDLTERLCPQPLAALYCEESHLAVGKEFNPAIEVWYPALLTRGQGKCVFRWTMPWAEAERAAREAEQRSEAARKAGRTLAGNTHPVVLDAASYYRGRAQTLVVTYHYVANELLRTVGKVETEHILRRAMRAWGTWRGEMMREEHIVRGWPLNIESFITHFDDPAAGDAWTAENVILTSDEHSKDIISSAYTDSFGEVGTGSLAVPMFDEALPAQALAYNPDIQLRIPMLMERGDSVTRFHYSLKSAANLK